MVESDIREIQIVNKFPLDGLGYEMTNLLTSVSQIEACKTLAEPKGNNKTERNMEKQFAYLLSIAVIHSIAMMMCETDIYSYLIHQTLIEFDSSHLKEND